MGLQLRAVRQSDALTLLEWANDPATRRNSLNSGTIELAAHLEWLAQKLADPECAMYILTDGENDLGVGRADLCGERALLSYTVAPRFRGRGYGNELIRLLGGNAAAALPRAKKLVAKVRADNTASARIFEKNGYALTADGEVLRFEKEIVR